MSVEAFEEYRAALIAQLHHTHTVLAQVIQATPFFPAIINTTSTTLHQAAHYIDAVYIHILPNATPWQIAASTIVLFLIIQHMVASVTTILGAIQHHGLLSFLAHAALELPILRSIVAKEKAKMMKKLQADVQATGADAADPPFTVLPAESLSAAALRTRLLRKQGKCVLAEEGHSTVSGTVYIAGKEHREIMNEAYTAFDLANPMHSNIFPSVRRMEAEVVAMTASILGGGPEGDANVCGAMTSGGSESILSAMKASRDYMRTTRGITAPEMIIAVSAHAAYYKAAEYFNIRLVRVPVGKDFRLSAATVRRAITRNTVVVVASAPGFPHGVVDDVEGIARVTCARGVLLHVDACLGGFVMPFARALGYPTPPFDFAVPGVTSMSVDTHKFGMAHKGTSVVLYRNKSIRKHQYTRITDWTGGLYISPGFAGSRNGGLISTAWAAMVLQGWEGYKKTADIIMKASTAFAAAIRDISQLQLTGEPDSCVVGFMATPTAARAGFNIYALNDMLTAKGWHLSSLQYPPALHMCFTAAHAEVVDALIKDLRACSAVLAADPAAAPDGSAPFYGMAAKMPDRRLVGDFLEAYQDALLDAS